MVEFRNESPIDFTIANARATFAAAIERLERSLPLHVPALIGGKTRESKEVVTTTNPSRTSQVIAKVHYAGETVAQEILKEFSCYRLSAAPDAWANLSMSARAAVIREAGAIMRRRREELAALIVLEAGKPWKEADADVVEAIDFCDYYAVEAETRLEPFRTMEVPGEENFYFYQPRGICVVVAPWNFPLAIACGMTVAGLVTGNLTILKPAEQTSAIAYELAKILLEAGVPKEAFAFLPGQGEIIGRALVDSPLTDMICFTGSKAVGLEIIKNAAHVPKGQAHIKRVIAEMGGKNAVIVDEDADLDEAVKGILYSGFGFAGQKCSAASRIILVGSAYEPFLQRLSDAVSDMIVGEAKDSSSYMGPVIDSEAQRRIFAVIEKGKLELTLSIQGAVPGGGYFVPPTVFQDVPAESALWTEEIFGPVLCCNKVKDFTEALRLANDSQYALTGGVFSRSPKNIDRARREFKVGNLYINRGCTGAIVCRQPFGGFKMSGIGSKAGGRDYLLQFVEPRTVTENTMRRGFAPE